MTRTIYFYFLLILLPLTSIAAKNSEYDDNFYKEEGRLIFKLKGYGIFSSGTQKGFPANNQQGNPANTGKISNTITTGWGLEGSTIVFFNDNIASELNLGLQIQNVSSTALEKVGKGYGANGYTSVKKGKVYGVPIGLNFQYYPFPFGGISPYIGAGYSAIFKFSDSKAFKLHHAHGPVLQVGVDIIARNDSIFTIEVKKYFLKDRFTYKSSFLGGNNPVKSSVKSDPWVISAGLGIKF